MKAKRAPLVTLPKLEEITTVPLGMTKKTINSYYMTCYVHGTANLVEVYRGKICVLIWDILQQGVVYYNSSFKNQIIYTAYEKAISLKEAASGEYSFSKRLTYLAPIEVCASKNSEYRKEFDKLDKVPTGNGITEMVKENAEFYRRAGILMYEPSVAPASVIKREYNRRKKAGLVCEWTEERKQRRKLKQNQKV
jgi:hypothetical protein